jgi:hypothetical protein
VIELKSEGFSTSERFIDQDEIEYQRYCAEAWEELRGSSWEPCYGKMPELEKAFLMLYPEKEITTRFTKALQSRCFGVGAKGVKIEMKATDADHTKFDVVGLTWQMRDGTEEYDTNVDWLKEFMN